MRREFSAGAVLVRRLEGRWVVAAIRPGGKPPGTWALPKGRIDEGERAEATALREVAEETGAHGESLGKLGDVHRDDLALVVAAPGADGKDAAALRLLLRRVRKHDAADGRLLFFEYLDDQAVTQWL